MEELSQMPPQHGPPTGHEGPRAGTGLKGQQPLGLPAFHPNSVLFRNVFFIHDPGARPSCTPGPRRAAFPTPEHVDWRGPRAAGGGAAGAPPPGLRPDPRPAATWGEGPRWPPRDPHPGRTRRPRRSGGGEGRPGNVSDLGSGRPPLPAVRPRHQGCPTEAPGGGGGAQLAAKSGPAAPPDLRKFVRAPPRHGHAQKRLGAGPRSGPEPPRAKAEGARPARTPVETTEDQKGSRKDGCSGSRCHQYRPPPQNHRRKTSKDAHHIVNGWPHRHEVLQRSEAPRRLRGFHSLIPACLFLMSLTFINYPHPIPWQST
nr:translation initiation factor IF-2-like [Pan paniscus]